MNTPTPRPDMAPEVLVASSIRPAQMEALEKSYVLHRLDQAEDPAALLAQVGPSVRAVVTTGGVGAPAELIGALPALEIVATSSVGTDAIDLDYCRARGIQVTNTPDVLTDDVADLAMGLLLASHRRIVAADAWVRSGDWAERGPFPLTTALRGQRLGVLGLGRIGAAIAARAEPFGMQIGYCTRSPRDLPYQYFATPGALAEWCDVLMVALPGGAANDGIVSAEVIEALGATGTLINIARGSVVDEPALIAALSQGRLRHAGLDVFRGEPAPSPALTALPNVTLSPHHASGTVMTRDAMAQLVVDNLSAWFAGAPLLTPLFPATA